jgi:antitoxin component of MazEF toxin-antitoxin module
MLKKLVRYGNSNALVLDKAILELLNISEGSVVKISTDGRSIILTPQNPQASVNISQTFTSTNALRAAHVQETLKAYPHLSEAQQAVLGAELLGLTEKHAELMMSLGTRQELQKELARAQAACAGDRGAFLAEYHRLIATYVPEITALEQAMRQLHEKCQKLSGQDPDKFTPEKQKTMEKEMAQVFEKHKIAQMKMQNFTDSPEYQHKAQLIAEKYQGNQNSAEFMHEIKELMYEFCPEMRQIHQDLDVVFKKYQQNP